MGSFALEPLFFTYAYLGGPLGELVQWSDLITSLYVLGHNLTITSNETDIPRYNILVLNLNKTTN